MKAATGPVRAFTAAIGSANAKVAGFLGGLVGGVSLAAGARFVKQQAEAADALGKNADQLGINVKALKAYEIGARKSGIEQENLISGLTKFSQKLSDAAAGDKTAKELFEGVGLDPKQLISQGLDGALRQTADAIAGVTNQTDRLAVSTDFFGRGSGRAFLSFLEDGSSGLDAMMEDAKRLGAALDRVDIAEIEAANDAYEDISIALENIGGIIALKVAPFVTDLSTRIAESIAQGNRFGEEITSALRGVAKAVYTLKNIWEALNVVVLTFRATVLASLEIIAKGLQELLVIWQTFNPILANILPMPDMDELDTFIAGLESGIEEINKQIRDMDPIDWSAKGVDQYFDNVIAKSRAAAESRVNDNAAIGDSIRRMNDISDQKTKQVSLSGALNYLRNAAMGRQINAAQVTGPRDLQRVQSVEDPQLRETNKLLGGILDATKNSDTAVYA